MSRTTNALNWTGYQIIEAVDAVIGNDERDLRGAIPVGIAAFMAGLRHHRAFTPSKSKKGTASERREARIQQYMKDNPVK